MKKTFSPIFLQIPSLVVIWSLVGYVLGWLLYSLFHSYPPGGEPVFVGITNFGTMFNDSRLLNAALRTAYYAGVGTLLQVLIGMGVALALINFVKSDRIRFALLLLFLIPMTLSEAIAAHIWLMLVTPQGYINSILRYLGLAPVGWLSESMALNTLILADVWQWTPLPMLLIYAARSAIPQDLYESAKLDRLSSLTTFKVVTWPRIKHAVIVAALLRFIFAYITIDKIILITYGGPGLSTETVGFYVWMQSFTYRNLGYAATLSFTTMIVAAVIAYFFWRTLRR